ncbi:MAG TPA: oligosaccharide flippase family protein [Pyrinomonadaceae bacterium]
MAEAGRKESSLTVRAAWIMSARTLAFVLSFALPLLLVRRLDQTSVGLYKQVFLIVGTAMNVLPLGFHMSAFYFLPREPERRGEVVFNILLFHLLVAAAACLAFVLRPGLIVALFPNSVELVAYAPALGILLLLWVVSSFLEAIAMANQETKTATAFIVSMNLARTLLLLAAAVWFASVESLIYAAIIQGALQTVVLLVYLFARFEGFGRRFDPRLFRTQMSYALPLGIAGFLYTMQMDMHNYFVSNRFDAATFAIYNFGCFNLPLIHILSDSIGSVMIPRVAELEKQGARREIIVLVSRMMRKLALAYFALYAFLIVMGREFIIVMFREQYLPSWPIFAVNLAMIPLGMITSAYDPVMRAYPEHRFFLLRARAALLGALFVALWFGTERVGLVGVISLVVLTNLLERVVVAVRCGKALGMTWAEVPLFGDVGKLACAAACAAIATALARALVLGTMPPFFVLAVCGVVFAVVYLAGVWLLKILSADERAGAGRALRAVQRHTIHRRRAVNDVAG